MFYAILYDYDASFFLWEWNLIIPWFQDKWRNLLMASITQEPRKSKVSILMLVDLLFSQE